MKYDFDTVVDRAGNDAAKYDERIKKFGTDKVIPLWIADMDFKTAQPVLDALEAKVKQGVFGYTTRCDEYFDSIARWQERRNGWKPDTALMSFASGVVPALAALVRQFAAEGESVLIQPPVYPEFYEVAENCGREVLENRLAERDGIFSLDLNDFEEKLKQGPKVFILCNPHNPVGHAWREEELRAMGELCLKYKVPVVSDEIHADLMMFGHKHIPMAAVSPEIAANTITCTAVSKTFNLAGMQAATVVFNNQIEREKFEKFWHSLEIHRNNPFSLVASIAAMNQGEEWLDQLLAYIEGNMRFVRDYLEREIPQIKTRLPEATYLLWLDCRALGMDDAALEKFMVEKAGIGLNSGNPFDPRLHGFMRMNLACPQSVLKQALEQLKKAVDEQ
ncbi:MAG: pyridoxal phosphate-dependent aminotransferase [Clostridia bacterium]|nr:pyridoxal phosphate-dependent aminotransferase [Clostridia bacterium]